MVKRLVAALAIAPVCLPTFAAQPGEPDPTWSPPGGAALSGFRTSIDSLLALPDGRLLVGGRLDQFGQLPRDRIVCLLQDGSLDESFTDHHRLSETLSITAIARQTDGRLLLGGGRQQGSALTNWLVRVDRDGAPDPGFPPVSALPGRVEQLLVTPQQEVLVCGSFYGVQGTPLGSLARLRPSGLLDASFRPEPVLDGTVTAGGLQVDQKLIVAYQVPERVGNRLWSKTLLRRLDRDGRPDPSFVSTDLSQTYLGSILSDQDGWLLGGHDHLRLCLIRLSADGRRDTAFQPQIPDAEGTVNALVRQLDGKVIVALDAETGVIRLNRDGTRDASFVAPAIFHRPVTSLALSPEGTRVYVGDSAGTVHRLLVSNQPEPSWIPAVTGCRIRADGAFEIRVSTAPQPTRFLESSLDLVGWQPVTSQGTASGESIFIVSGKASGAGFFRVGVRW